jgi:PAS domain S-box-containing protein
MMTTFGAMTTAVAALLLALFVLARAHRRALAAERKRAFFWEQLLSAAPDPLLIFDESGRIHCANRAAAQLFGYGPQELAGQMLTLLLVPTNDDEDARRIEHLLLAPAPNCAAVNTQGKSRDGTLFPAMLRSRSIASEAGSWVLVAVRDLTGDVSLKGALQRYVKQLLTAKEALQQYNNDLQSLVEQQTAELRIAKDRAEDAKAAQTEFLANMSHELRTPLHGILSFARFGMKKYDSAGAEKLLLYYQRIESAGQTLLKLLNALLDLSKLESRAVELERASISVKTLICGIADEFTASLREKDLALAISPSESPALVFGDHEKLSQVFRNLLGNSLKFTPVNGQICISLDQHDGTLIVSIRDTGPGIPDEDCERVFDKFVQSSITKTGAGGTGLGLSICREIVRLHGGTIRAVPTHGRGALVQVCLPLYTPARAPSSTSPEHCHVVTT